MRSAAHVEGINISTSSRSSARLDLEEEVVRVAPHYFNTDDELEALLRMVGNLAR